MAGMPITLVTGPANAGKAEVVMDAVRRHLAHGEEPLLIVPTRADVEHYLRELAAGEAAMGVRVERFAGLIAEVVRRAGVAEAVLGGLARERLLEQLAEGATQRPAGAGYVSALGEILTELQVRRVTPARLERALQAWLAADGQGVSRVRLGGLFAEYHAALARLGRVDAEQRAVRALDALRERPAMWGRTPVLFYGFDDLTPLQLDAIETLGRVVGAQVTVSLSYEPGRTAFAGRAATFHALAPLAGEHRALERRADHYAPRSRAALSHLERSLFEPGATRAQAGSAVRLLEGGGERAELELIAHEISELLARGMVAEEIAVLVRPAGTSVDLLEEVLSAAAIPFSLSRRRRFADTALGRALIGLLRCTPASEVEAPAGDLGDLLAWLRAPGVLKRPGLADSLEIGARRRGALTAAGARALWDERNWSIEVIDQLQEAQRRGPVALIDRAARELQRLFCAPRRAGAAVLAADELDEAAALAAGARALAELRELARIAPALAPATAAALASSLAGVEFFSGQGAAAPSQHAVAVLDPLALRARRVRALFVSGLQEGVFPGRGRPQPFLGEDERRRLAEVSGLRLGETQDALAAERYLLYAVLSRPQELLYLSWHVADDEGQPTSRSLFVEDVCDLFTEDLYDGRARRALGAVDDARAPGAAAKPPSPQGSLRDERLLAGLRARVWSASSIERWIGCPVRWYVETMLAPGSFEPEPEPLARGGVAHEALRDTLAGLARETGTACPTPANLGLARELLASSLDVHEAARPLSAARERRLALRRRLHADLERYLEYAAASDSPLEPSELELGFGFDADDERAEGSTLPPFELGGGVLMRGRIDRIDVDSAGAAVVYDYKGRKAAPAARWIRDGDLQVALYMRAVEQLLGLRVVGGFYQPLAGDLRARGVLDGDAGLELECVQTDRVEHERMHELLEEALAGAREVAEQAGRGALEARPKTCAFMGGCLYPAICRCER